MPFSFNQYASVPATSRNGRPEENPNNAMVPAAGCAKARQIEGLRGAATGSVGIVDRVGRMVGEALLAVDRAGAHALAQGWRADLVVDAPSDVVLARPDRKSTRLNSSHVEISYAVFCLKKKT